MFDMSHETKNCPKCNATMESTSICVVPEQQVPVFHSPISAFRGLAVQPYHCPTCRYVEFYSAGELASVGLPPVLGEI